MTPTKSNRDGTVLGVVPLEKTKEGHVLLGDLDSSDIYLKTNYPLPQRLTLLYDEKSVVPRRDPH